MDAPREDAVPAPPAPRIVVVDRSAFFREAVCRALAAAGHRCAGAPDLASAPEPEAGDVALWVLDVASTGAAGLAAWRAARERRPALRAIVLSDGEDPEGVLEALRAGASDYLAKPLHEEELRLAVDRALSAWRTETELARLRGAAGPDRAGAPAGADAADEGDLALARDLCRAITGHGDAERVLDALVRILAGHLGARSVALYLRDRDGRDFVRERQWDGAAGEDRRRLPGGRGLTGAAAETGVFVAARRPAEDPRFDPEVDTPLEADPAADGGAPLLCLPLRFRERTVGLARAFLPPGAEPSLRTAEVAGAALSAAIRCVLLYRSWRSGVDELARARREATARAPGPGWVPREPGAE